MKKLVFMAAVATLALSACSNSEEIDQATESVQLQITAGIGNSATRAENTTWTSGAKIVINDITNTGYYGKVWTIKSITENNTKATFTPDSGNEYSFTEGTVNFSAFTNNEATATSVSTTDGSVNVTVYDGNAPADLYFAQATASSSNPIVTFEFKHAMAKVTIKFTKEDASLSDVSSFKLSGYYTAATVAKDGTVTTSNQEGNSVDVNSVDSSNGNSFVVIPSTPTLTLEVTAGTDKKYYATLSGQEYAANKHYTYLIKLTKTSLQVIGGDTNDQNSTGSNNGCTISDWENNCSTIEKDATMVNKSN